MLHTVLSLCFNLVVKLIKFLLNVALELSTTMVVNVVLVGGVIGTVSMVNVLGLGQASLEVSTLARVGLVLNGNHSLEVDVVVLDTMLRILLDLMEQLIILVLNLMSESRAAMVLNVVLVRVTRVVLMLVNVVAEVLTDVMVSMVID